MSNPSLTSTYLFYRQPHLRCRPSRALEMARKDIAENKTRHALSAVGAMRGGADWKIGRDSVFFCEWPDAYMRRVGFVDEIPNESRMRGKMVDHKGWYLEDDYSGEVARGVVFQLPAHKGKCRYLSAIADPHNDGPAILSLGLFDELSEAARNADQLAERYAETERDYNRAWQAGQRYSELGADIAEHRSDCLALIREIKAQGAAFGPAICSTLRAHVESHLRDIGKARSKRAELVSEYGNCDAFNDGKAE